jgi:GcrA cell cycle regulator
MEWTEESIVRLRTLWDEGLSTAEIGRQLGVSKNAVVGKAHRLDLPARPSPIRRDGSSVTGPRRQSPRRMAGPTLPPLSSAQSQVAPSVAVLAPALAASRLKPAAPAPVPRVQAVAPRPYARLVTCCWPIGEPGTRSFRFCDADALPGKPYCAEHAQLAYVKVRDRREDAA